ncbi:class I SAM-dependent methyltransferase [Halioxenophilus aromaticivorans]|uniref:Class I SAM-dependent methyltransferase n=1 Tax=Halioxenophilus aromaticivorans TaxID=1306992 RepID=A0AAV3U5P4_9ALTE
MHTVDYQRLTLPEDCKLLDLGCGEGRHCLGVPLREAATVVGVDLNLSDVRTAVAKVPEHNGFCQQAGLPLTPTPHFSVADGTQLPFADGCFDVVVCSEVLEHIEPYPEVLEEIMRVLKPGGQLVVSVPRQWPERLCWSFSEQYHNQPGGHIRIFNAHKLGKEIQNLGASFTGQHWAHALHSPYWWLKCLLWEEPQHPIVQAYHRFLVWDLTQSPWLTRGLETLLNPIMGKSVVLYFER